MSWLTVSESSSWEKAPIVPVTRSSPWNVGIEIIEFSSSNFTDPKQNPKARRISPQLSPWNACHVSFKGHQTNPHWYLTFVLVFYLYKGFFIASQSGSWGFTRLSASLHDIRLQWGGNLQVHGTNIIIWLGHVPFSSFSDASQGRRPFHTLVTITQNGKWVLFIAWEVERAHGWMNGRVNERENGRMELNNWIQILEQC